MTSSDDPDPGGPLERYPSLAAFYNADRARLRSPERDVGLWWRGAAKGPLHRAAWVRDTGELYLTRLGPEDEGGGRVEVLARVSSLERLELALKGWRERCGGPGSLWWLRVRAETLAKCAARGGPRAPAAAAPRLV
ncbi:MAG: hypothetical protein ACLQBB_03615 [Solirubrobacteraceae bacterium]